MSGDSVVLYSLIAVLVGLLVFKGVSLLVTALHHKEPIDTKQILGETFRLSPADLCFPVRYASERHFQRPFTLYPWETVGALVVTDSEFIFVGKPVSGQRFRSSFKRDNCLVVYVERRQFRDGGLSWFYLENEAGERHYFCTDGTLPEMTTEFGTTALYEKITERYSNN